MKRGYLCQGVFHGAKAKLYTVIRTIIIYIYIYVSPHITIVLEDINTINNAVTCTHTGRRDTVAGV